MSTSHHLGDFGMVYQKRIAVMGEDISCDKRLVVGIERLGEDIITVRDRGMVL
jgi:hypothetical protein